MQDSFWALLTLSQEQYLCAVSFFFGLETTLPRVRWESLSKEEYFPVEEISLKVHHIITVF